MDDELERILKRETIKESRARLIKEIQVLRDAIDERQRILDAIDGGDREPPGKYEVIDDIAPLVMGSDHPILQSELFRLLRSRIIENLRYDEEDAKANLARSLWYHTTRKGEGSKDDRGVRAVEKHGDRYRIVPFKTKGAKTQYPDNLIWHVSKIKG